MIEIPTRMRHLDRDTRGYPIPVLVYRDAAGKPHFTINDDEVRERVIRRDLCGICGGKLYRGRWFVGGPKAAFHDDGAYVDPPMHGECARYALSVCPYLAAPSYGKRLDAKTLRGRTDPKTMLLLDPTQDPDRPAVFVAVMSIGQWVSESGLQNYLHPNRPYRQVEYWQHGRRLNVETVLDLGLEIPDAWRR